MPGAVELAATLLLAIVGLVALVFSIMFVAMIMGVVGTITIEFLEWSAETYNQTTHWLGYKAGRLIRAIINRLKRKVAP